MIKNLLEKFDTVARIILDVINNVELLFLTIQTRQKNISGCSSSTRQKVFVLTAPRHVFLALIRIFCKENQGRTSFLVQVSLHRYRMTTNHILYSQIYTMHFCGIQIKEVYTTFFIILFVCIRDKVRRKIKGTQCTYI